MNDNLFIPILDVAATSEAVIVALREVIFWSVVNNTAENTRVSENEFERMRQTAKNAAVSASVEFRCDGRNIDSFKFTEGNHRLITTLQKLHNTILQYDSWYENDECEADCDGCGFYWHYNNHCYSFIFRR